MALVIRQPIFEKIRVWLLIKVFWRNHQHYLNSMVKFSVTEADGVWHLCRAVNSGDIINPHHRALIFAQLIEEFHHADIFRSLYEQQGVTPFTRQFFERKTIYPDEDVVKILYFVHVGEDYATTRFYLIRKYLPVKYQRLAMVLRKILLDEERHITLSDNILLELGLTECDIQRGYRAVKFRRLREEWVRMGVKIVNKFATIFLTCIYYLFAPLFFMLAKKYLKLGAVPMSSTIIKRM